MLREKPYFSGENRATCRWLCAKCVWTYYNVTILQCTCIDVYVLNVIKLDQNTPKNVLFFFESALHPSSGSVNWRIPYKPKIMNKVFIPPKCKNMHQILLAYHIFFVRSFCFLSGSYSSTTYTKRNKLKRVEFNWNIERIISKGFGVHEHPVMVKNKKKEMLCNSSSEKKNY